MTHRVYLLGVLAGLILFVGGCSSGPKLTFPELHPARGLVRAGSNPATGGFLQLVPEAGPNDYLVNGTVGADGSFMLTTTHINDKSGDRRTGAPLGTYKATFTPPSGDQTAGPTAGPLTAKAIVTIKAGENNLVVDLPKK